MNSQTFRTDVHVRIFIAKRRLEGEDRLRGEAAASSSGWRYARYFRHRCVWCCCFVLRENYSGRHQNGEKGDVQIFVYETLTAINFWNVRRKFCSLYIFYFSFFSRGSRGCRGGGSLWGYFSAQGFKYLNTSHLKSVFIPKRTGPLYMSKNI